MTFNLKHFLVQTAIVGTLLSPLLQSCGGGDDGLTPDPEPEPPVVVDPPGGEEPGEDLYLITDTASIDLRASDIIFSIVDYGEKGNDFLGEMDAPFIYTDGGLIFECTPDASKAIGEVTGTISFECPPDFATPGQFDNVKANFVFTAYGNHYFTQGTFLTSAEAMNIGSDYAGLNKHTAIDRLTINNMDISEPNVSSGNTAKFTCFDMAVESNRQTGAASSFYGIIQEALEKTFCTPANQVFKEDGYAITVIDEFGRERNEEKATNIQFLSEAFKTKDESFIITAKFLVEKTSTPDLEMYGSYWNGHAVFTIAKNKHFVGVVPK